MYIFKHVKDLHHFLNGLRKENAAIGFVPTMGALHKGHLSLVKAAKKDCDCVVTSIFVNPTQFNEKSDLEKYPRAVPADIRMLTNQKNSVLFLPAVNEIYPEGLDLTNKFDFGKMVTIMEGAHRPGHFDGVISVVRRLVEIVQPDRIYMGQKDYQQQAVIGKLLQFMESKTQLVTCPIIREEDGLAMSSRNVRLTPNQRKLAPIISKTLFEAKAEYSQFSPQELKKRALKKLSVAGTSINYFEIVDATSLVPLDNFEDAESAVICTTVKIGDIRLLDNIILY